MGHYNNYNVEKHIQSFATMILIHISQKLYKKKIQSLKKNQQI